MYFDYVVLIVAFGKYRVSRHKLIFQDKHDFEMIFRLPIKTNAKTNTNFIRRNWFKSLKEISSLEHKIVQF